MRIFLSYSFKDSESANLIKKKLLENNYSVIEIDPEFKIGEDIAINIEKAINSADAFIILLSKYYMESKYSDYELMMIYDNALLNKKVKGIFPILLDKSARIPSILLNVVYADWTDKNISSLDEIILKLNVRLKENNVVEHKKIKDVLKEQEYYLKLQEIEYQIQKDKQKKIRNVFQWSFLLVLIISSMTSILFIFRSSDFMDKIDFYVNFQNIIFYLLGFLTAIIPSLYFSIKLKNRKNGK